MKKPIQTVLMFTCAALVVCLALVAQGLARLDTVVAQLPSETPIDPTLTPLTPPAETPTPTETSTPTDTPTPSDTPVSTSTPTNTTAPAHTATPTYTATPTHTATPTKTPTSTKEPGGPENTKEPDPTSKPDPNCRSVVEGDVIDAAGQQAKAATVYIQGAGWSNAMMTDDNGHYGFGGLCAGMVTLQGYLLDGQTTQPGQANLNGKDSVRLDLIVQQSGGAAVTEASTPQATVTPEPDMPATGYSGLLLVGAALLGVLMLILAGTRRALSVEQRTRDGD